jgi:DNA-binding CsgD family transcriptional regulator
MDRVLLQALLGEGLSLAEIGRRMGRHESTVSYWLGKHGLHAAHRSAHAPKGRIARAELAALVEAGLSAARIGDSVQRSPTTVLRWLKEYGLQTHWTARRRAIAAGERRLVARCPRHGVGEFSRMTGGGFRCTRCRSEAVSRRRRRVKQVLVEEAGGRCSRCGYDRCVAALEFHHVNPSEKRFTLSGRGVGRSLEKARAEAAKCVLLCSNCHAEVEAVL